MKNKFIIFCVDGNILIFKNGFFEFYTKQQIFDAEDDMLEMPLENILMEIVHQNEPDVVIFYNLHSKKQAELMCSEDYISSDGTPLWRHIRTWLTERRGG